MPFSVIISSIHLSQVTLKEIYQTKKLSTYTLLFRAEIRSELHRKPIFTTPFHVMPRTFACKSTTILNFIGIFHTLVTDLQILQFNSVKSIQGILKTQYDCSSSWQTLISVSYFWSDCLLIAYYLEKQDSLYWH